MRGVKMRKTWTGKVKVDRNNYASITFPVATYAEIEYRGPFRTTREWEFDESFRSQDEAIKQAEKLTQSDHFKGLPKFFGGQ